MKIALSILIAAVLNLNTAQACEEHAGKNPPAANPACPVYFEQSKTCLSIEFTKGPFANEESQFIAKFFQVGADNSITMIEPQNLKMDLWMSMGHHGHGSSPLKIVRQGLGEYYISEAYFVMNGTWSIRTTVNNELKEFKVVIP